MTDEVRVPPLDPVGLLDLGGLTDSQLRRAGLAIGGLLAGGPDRATALAEISALRAEQTATLIRRIDG